MLKRLARILIVVCGVGGASGWPGIASTSLRAQDEEFIEEDVIEEGDDDDDDAGIPGVVGLSDGTYYRGQVSFGRGQRLRVYDVRTKRIYNLELSRIEAIRTLVETEKLEEAWAFEEEGFRKKIKLGWTYPLRNYCQEVQLTGGQIIAGHCYAAVIYVDDGKKDRKLVLPRTQRGKADQTLDDLVYPATVYLGGTPSSGTRVGKADAVAFGEIAGQLSGLSTVAAIDQTTGKGFRGKVSAGGAYRVAGLLPGPHALFIRRGQEIHAGLPAKDALSEADAASVDERIAKLVEFFEARRILLRGGDRNRLWLLLELRREGKTTLGDGEGGTARVIRWEMWIIKRLKGRWKIESRVFLDRQLLKKGEAFPSVRARREPEFWGVRVMAGKQELPAPAGAAVRRT